MESRIRFFCGKIVGDDFHRDGSFVPLSSPLLANWVGYITFDSAVLWRCGEEGIDTVCMCSECKQKAGIEW